jgi:hypothetical protein
VRSNWRSSITSVVRVRHVVDVLHAIPILRRSSSVFPPSGVCAAAGAAPSGRAASRGSSGSRAPASGCCRADIGFRNHCCSTMDGASPVLSRVTDCSNLRSGRSAHRPE